MKYIFRRNKYIYLTNRHRTELNRFFDTHSLDLSETNGANFYPCGLYISYDEIEDKYKISFANTSVWKDLDKVKDIMLEYAEQNPETKVLNYSAVLDKEKTIELVDRLNKHHKDPINKNVILIVKDLFIEHEDESDLHIIGIIIKNATTNVDFETTKRYFDKFKHSKDFLNTFCFYPNKEFCEKYGNSEL